MGKAIDMTKPLSEEDEAWLRSRARGWEVDENKRRLADQKKAEGEDDDEPEEPEFVKSYQPAAEFFEGGPAQHVPSPVGVEPEMSVPTGESAVGGDAEAVKATPVETVDIEDLTVAELKEELENRELPTTGNKDALVKRLKEALAKDE